MIWIPAFEEREKFYKLIEGEDVELDDAYKLVRDNKDTIMSYNKKCIDKYKEKCNDIANRVVSIIERNINKEDVDNKI